MLLLCVPLVLWLKKSQKTPAFTPASFSKSRYPAPRQSIGGFDFTSVHDGEPVLSIKADSLRIDKKKMGFLRIGLAEEAVLDNAQFRIYGYQPAAPVTIKSSPENNDLRPLEKSPANPLPKQKSSGKSRTADNQFVLRDIFTKQLIPPVLASDKLAFITARPVSLEICRGEDVVSRFTADQGSFNLRKRQILLTGSVIVKSGKKTLRTSKLVLNPVRALLKTKGAFTLTTLDGVVSGERIMADILLNSKNMMNR